MSVKFLDHVEVGGNLVRFLGDPVDATDAANRRWVLNEIAAQITASGSLDVEGVQDVVGAMVRGTGITPTYDDVNGTITLTVTDSPTVNGNDSAFLLARANHTGTQSLDTTTDSATRLAFLPAERTKLDGVAAGATANATDAFLVARGNHTGTQPLATITGHDKAAHDALGIDAATVGGATAAGLRDRATHTGTQSLDTTTDSATRLAMSAAERTKLTGVADGATANSTDAFLLSRANHTGTQPASTITGLTAAVDNIIDGATSATATTAVTLTTFDAGTPADATDDFQRVVVTTTVTDSPLLGGNNPAYYTNVDNHVDGTTNHVFTAADDTKLAGIAAGATANSTDAFLLARANHTGTQSADTLISGTANKVFTAAEQTKLAGIAEGATANATDAALRDRTTHTGTQPLSTITGHDKATHDALLIDAATVGGQTAADIQSAVTAAIVDGAPGTLDTLNEIAAALGDNPDVINELLRQQALRNRTFAATIGDGVATSFTVTHGLGTRDVTVQIYETGGSFDQVSTTVRRSTADAVTVVFATAPAAGAYRVVVQGRPDPAPATV